MLGVLQRGYDLIRFECWTGISVLSGKRRKRVRGICQRSKRWVECTCLLYQKAQVMALWKRVVVQDEERLNGFFRCLLEMIDSNLWERIRAVSYRLRCSQITMCLCRPGAFQLML